MKRYLVRKCPECKGVVKIIMDGNKIDSLENAVPVENGLWAKGRYTPKYGGFWVESSKRVRCTATRYRTFSGFRYCGRIMLISKFKEIKI